MIFFLLLQIFTSASYCISYVKWGVNQIFFPPLHYILLVNELLWDYLSHNSPYCSIWRMLISRLPWECSVQAPRPSGDDPQIQQWKCLGIESLIVFLLNALSQPAFLVPSSFSEPHTVSCCLSSTPCFPSTFLEIVLLFLSLPYRHKYAGMHHIHSSWDTVCRPWHYYPPLIDYVLHLERGMSRISFLCEFG